MAKTPIKRTGITEETAKHFIINAGAVYSNLTYSTPGGWEGELLGATSGGNEVAITMEFREIEIDGAFSKYVGQKVLLASDATLTANVKEITSNVIKMSILGVSEPGDGTTVPAEYMVISGKGKVEPTDYLTNIALVGEISGTNEPIIVILDNALCTSGLNFSTADDDEAVVSMVFEAHADADQIDDRKLPARIYMPIQA